jgi:hypothetical protein
MSTFEFKLAIRDPDEPVNYKAISELPAFLDDDTDQAVLRELLCIIQRAAYALGGVATVGQVEELIASLDTDERKLWLDACRKSAGLEPAEDAHRKAMQALRIPDTRDLQLYITESGTIASRTLEDDERQRVQQLEASLARQRAALAADRASDAQARDEHRQAVDDHVNSELPIHLRR